LGELLVKLVILFDKKVKYVKKGDEPLS